MRQMACHPDLVLRSKTNSAQFAVDDAGEAIVCRLCNDVAEDAIHAKCRHLFDRECIKRYIEASPEDEVRRFIEQELSMSYLFDSQPVRSAMSL